MALVRTTLKVYYDSSKCSVAITGVYPSPTASGD